jgi:hypothetical protein
MRSLPAIDELGAGRWPTPDNLARISSQGLVRRHATLAEARSKGEEPSDFLKMTAIRYSHIPDFKDAKIPSWTETSMTPELIEEWWRIVSPREFQIQALLALKAMWEGAPKLLSDEAKTNIVPWDSVIQFIQGYGLSLSK